MSEVELQEVQWLWKPYIQFGKLTIIQGDPGEGKTTFALRLAAACSSGKALPGMGTTEPFHVIYQTAEDGLGDTIKPRLIDAGTDENRVLNIVEDSDPLSLSDERIEKTIIKTGTRLMILDPIQGYIGEDVDINRANEIRSVLKKVAAVADRTGCAIVLVEHLNKAKGSSSQYRAVVKGESWKFRLMSVIDSAMNKSGSKQEFISEIQKHGYELTWTDERKYITFYLSER